MSCFDWLFPRHCILCKKLSRGKFDLCLACKQQLPYIGNAYADLLTVFYYEEPISRMLINLKFNQQLKFASLLGSLVSEVVAAHYKNKPNPEIIIPVPLHASRLKERGYNQALEIARPVAKKLNIYIDKYSCKRTKNTAPQLGLTEHDRQSNLHGAFQVTKLINAKHVAIFDDVVTTGSTVRELSLLLRKSGVEQVDVWCVAKTRK